VKFYVAKFMEFNATLPSLREMGVKGIKFSEISLGKEALKTIF